MVSQKLIKEYDFETIEDYYQYIVDSYINGQSAQVTKLIKMLSKRQKIEFLELLESDWIDENVKLNLKKRTLKEM